MTPEQHALYLDLLRGQVAAEKQLVRALQLQVKAKDAWIAFMTEYPDVNKPKAQEATDE